MTEVALYFELHIQHLSEMRKNSTIQCRLFRNMTLYTHNGCLQIQQLPSLYWQNQRYSGCVFHLFHLLCQEIESPDITGSFLCYWSTINQPTGCFKGEMPTRNGASDGGQSGEQYFDKISFLASRANTIYNSSTVQPKIFYVLTIIKI